MKHSFVGLSESPSKFKEIIEESLGSKAYSILSNKTFQEAAAFGLLEFQDNEDQQIPQMTPEEIIKFFSDCTVVHDRKFNPGKRILSKHDTHMEVPNEDMKAAYKKVFGCEIHKDPELAKFFESEQLDEVLPVIAGLAARAIPAVAGVAARAIPAVARAIPAVAGVAARAIPTVARAVGGAAATAGKVATGAGIAAAVTPSDKPKQQEDKNESVEEVVEEGFKNSDGSPITAKDRKPLTRTANGSAVKAADNKNPFAGKRTPIGVKR